MDININRPKSGNTQSDSYSDDWLDNIDYKNTPGE